MISGEEKLSDEIVRLCLLILNRLLELGSLLIGDEELLRQCAWRRASRGCSGCHGFLDHFGLGSHLLPNFSDHLDV